MMVKKLFAAFFVTLFAFALPVNAQSVERPTLKVGDEWVYSIRNTQYAKPATTFSVKVVALADNRITVNWENKDVGTSGVDVFDMNLSLLDPYVYKMFDFPLSIGKTWSFEYNSSEGTSRWHNKVAGKIVSLEKVTVPAGTFDTVKVVLIRDYVGSGIGGSSWTGTVTDTWWYAPQTKSFVKRTFSDSGKNPTVRELLKYALQ